MPTESQIQIGVNLRQGVVKIRAADEGSDGGWVIMALHPIGARLLATWLTDGAQGKVIKVSDGVRWVEHVVPPYSVEKIAADLRACAKQAEDASAPS